MKSAEYTRLALMLLTLTALLCTSGNAAVLHDPMRPENTAAALSAAEVEEAAAILPPLTAILIGPDSRRAVFGNIQVQEGEQIGSYRISRIHRGRVELFDGKTRLERRLFPAISTFEDNR
jgi:hypothetical protein